MNRIKLALLAGSALFATPAFADDQTTPATDGTTAGGDTSMDPTAAAAAGMGTAVGATVATQVWPRSLDERPYIVGKGKIAAYGQYQIQRTAFVDSMTMVESSINADAFGVGGAYGVTDKINAGAQYGFQPGLINTRGNEMRGALAFFGEYEILRQAKLNITASADFDVDFCGTVDLMNNCTTSAGIHAGLGARYGVAPKMAVFTGQPYGPGPVGQHLSISFDGPIDFALPVGFMYQATTELNVQAMTNLLNLGISDSTTTIIFRDAIPLTVGALYSVTPAIDVVGMFGLDDLKAGFDKLSFVVGARWYD